MVGFNMCIGFDNLQSNLYNAINAETKADYIRAMKEVEEDDTEIEEFLTNFMRWPMQFFVGGDPWEKLQEKRVELGIRTNNSNSSI
tara:strand:+ start:80 stop:337 length:258 start_codon:yes stop_codon:yes gene_type:complete